MLCPAVPLHTSAPSALPSLASSCLFSHHVRRLRGVPAVPTIALAVVVAGNYIAPVNPTVMLTFGEGYFTFGDMVKTGIVPAIALIVIMSLWMPFICGALGI